MQVFQSQGIKEAAMLSMVNCRCIFARFSVFSADRPQQSTIRRFVERIGPHQCGALHDGLFTPIRQSHAQLWEVHQHFCHFIASLSTAHVDDAITVTVLGQGLGNDGLATAKSPGNGTCSCTTLYTQCHNNNVDDAIIVTVFGQGLGDDNLATAKSYGMACVPAKHDASNAVIVHILEQGWR